MRAGHQAMIGEEQPEDWGLYFQAEEANCVVSMVKVGSPTNTVILEASTDGGYTWSTFYDESTSTTNAVTLANIGDRVYIRKSPNSSHNRFGTNPDDYRSFRLSKKAGAYGNVMSVVDETDTGKTRTNLPNDRTFQGLFSACTNLTHAPDLVATTLAFGCYYLMFYGCTSLQTAPALPATALATWCYSGMFQGCSSLTSAPTLNASTVPSYGYNQMFRGCSSLVTAPSLPATTIADNCYKQMFSGCSSLVNKPSTLPATTAPDYCYYLMFQNCTSLASAPSMSMTTVGTESCREMFNGCTNLTTPPSQLKPTTIKSGSYRGMFYNCSKLASAPTISATTVWDYGCQAMFMGCTTLATAPTLGATSVDEYAFAEMFRGCTNLTTPPASLPSQNTSPDCYQSMFQGCSKLASAPTISATSIDIESCKNMFNGCSALKTAPALNASNIEDYCYSGMFADCTSLTTGPSSLPATNLMEGCYQNMFLRCSALTSVPAVLPALEVPSYAYQYMFNGCSSLVNGPNIKATTFGATAAQGMFANTTKLSSVTVNFETWPTATNALASWFYNTKSSGTFNCPSKLGYNPSITRGTWNCPAGWTVVNPWEFFFEAEEANAKILLSRTGTPPTVKLEVSTNGGQTWTSSSSSMTLRNVGDRIYLRAGSSGNSAFASDASSNYLRFNSSSGGKYACYGNVGCLLRQTRTTSLPTSTYMFALLFYNNTYITKGPNIDILSPANYAVCKMFSGCTNLASACISTQSTTSTHVYYMMFYGCSSLNNISVGFTAWPSGSSALTAWVYHVASSGSFRCPSSLGTNSSIARGTGKCPSNWTVTNY